MSKNKQPEKEESFLDEPSEEGSLLEDVKRQVETRQALDARRDAVKAVAVVEDPEVVKYREQIAAIEAEIETETQLKSEAEKAVQAANKKVLQHRDRLDVLVTDLEILKNRHRNIAAENVQYIEAQIAQRAKDSAEAMAKRELALSCGLITQEQAKQIGASPIDVAIAAKNRANRLSRLARR